VEERLSLGVHQGEVEFLLSYLTVPRQTSHRIASNSVCLWFPYAFVLLLALQGL
jgi:hypothetical protein